MICVSIGSGNKDDARQILKKAGFIELRADLLNWSLDEYREVISTGGKTVFTCRPGKFDEQERLNLFDMAASAGAQYLDVEIESNESFLLNIQKITRKYSTKTIISYHNYETTPASENLESILSECYALGADVAKLACRVYSPADTARLLALYNISGRKVIIGMGKVGKITRIAAALLGAEFTFASQGLGEATAEGQLSFEEMKDLIKKLQ